MRIGIDLGGTKCLGLALDGDQRVVAEIRWPTPAGGDAVLDTLARLVRELEDAASGGGTAVAAETVGIGAPGLVDRRGVLQVAPNLPGIVGLPLRAELESRLSVPVDIDNDVNVAVWGEHRLGAARGRDDVVMVTLGTGIGGGIVTGGRLCRGVNGFAGEVGHMIVDPEGPPCPCGRRGCWERFASGSGLGWLARQAAQAGQAPRLLALTGDDVDAIRGEHVTRAVADGDSGGAEILRRFCWWVALGLANLAAAFDPEVFVIGGGLIDIGEALIGPVRTALDELLLGARARPTIDVVFAALGERAGAMGAACL